jgi:hypothetical protein
VVHLEKISLPWSERLLVKLVVVLFVDGFMVGHWGGRRRTGRRWFWFKKLRETISQDNFFF